MAGQARSLVFLDASVLVAAAHSPTGGSALVLEVLSRSAGFRAALSARVLLEARVNIAEDVGAIRESPLLRFYQQLAGLAPEMVPAPSPERLAQCATLVGEKDAHVSRYVGTLECGAAYLLTLDRHLMTPAVQAAKLRVRVVTPGDFLREIAAGYEG